MSFIKTQDENPNFLLEVEKKYDQFAKAIACQKEMYNLAKKKKAPKNFILEEVIDLAFKIGVAAYDFAGFQKNFDKIEYFRHECVKLSKVGHQIAKMCFGQQNALTKEWKERNQEFENWCKTFSK